MCTVHVHVHMCKITLCACSNVDCSIWKPPTACPAFFRCEVTYSITCAPSLLFLTLLSFSTLFLPLSLSSSLYFSPFLLPISHPPNRSYGTERQLMKWCVLSAHLLPRFSPSEMLHLDHLHTPWPYTTVSLQSTRCVNLVELLSRRQGLNTTWGSSCSLPLVLVFEPERSIGVAMYRLVYRCAKHRF